MSYLLVNRSVRSAAFAVGLALLLLPIVGCGGNNPPQTDVSAEPPQKLSEFGLFTGNGASQTPVEGVIPYDLNSPLFSDYTDKYRFVKLPAGQSAKYNATDSFEFPVGTVISKTFAYPVDARDPAKGRRLLETRILRHEADGWIGYPYIWNEEQTEAVLDVAGGTINAHWIQADGAERTNSYIIPNSNQCKGCHKQGELMLPIGPKARNLNRDFAYASGSENQLTHWTRVGALSGAPAPAEAPRLADWDDPHTGTLDERARAWLEINCAHCHNPAGPARNSGLDLMASQTNPTAYGIRKSPVAAGRGSGGMRVDIAPGHPEESILPFRVGSTDAGIMMPELGKRMIHTEGLALINEWIRAMPEGEGQTPAAANPAPAPGGH